MQYPLFISVSETAKIFGMGRTAIFQRIASGDFTTAKIGRSTRITFSSAIQFALRCLREGNGAGTLAEIFGQGVELDSCAVAEGLARRLCYTCKDAEDLGRDLNRSHSPDTDGYEAGSPEKNFGGEF